jgi:hypothetical protein
MGSEMSTPTTAPVGRHSGSEGERTLAAPAADVEDMLAFSRPKHIHGRKTQEFNLTVQLLLKLGPGFARCRIPIFDLRGVRRRFRDLRHVRYRR